MENRLGKDQVIFRTIGEEAMEMLDSGILSPTEWIDNDSYNRIYEANWLKRYEYEADIVCKITDDNNTKKIFELGSGPGMLCNKVLNTKPELEYHLFDIKAASIANKNENLGGIFHVRDLNNDFDTTGIDTDFDLFIANDFLEHIQNPAKVVLKAKSILNDNGLAIISVPNWRMGHGWIYRGLFDWDNFIHFMYQHGFAFMGYKESFLKCSFSSKLDTERSMPDELIDSWNFYMLFKKDK